MAEHEITKAFVKHEFHQISHKYQLGIENLKEEQVDAIVAVLNGKDTIGILPTGFGKSVVFYVLPLLKEKITNTNQCVLVVSPLVALMTDQLHYLRSHGIASCVIRKSEDMMSEQDRDAFRSGLANVVFASPEALTSKTWNAVLRSQYVPSMACLVFDEGHCVSQWGLDFRQAYADVAPEVQCMIGDNVPTLVLTATLTEKIKTDLERLLALDNCEIVAALPDRPEIYLSVVNSKRKPNEELGWVLTRLRNKKRECEKMLIFFTSMQSCQKVYNQFLVELGNDAYDENKLILEMFHAHHKPETKKRILNTYKEQKGPIRVLFSTIAFGMGVQIPDIDIVIHYGLTENVLTYWQETGRCARDGRHGVSITYAFKLSISRCKDDVMTNVAKRERCLREVVMEKFAVHDRQDLEYRALVNRIFCAGDCPDDPCQCLRCSCCIVCNSRCQCPKMQAKDGILM